MKALHLFSTARVERPRCTMHDRGRQWTVIGIIALVALLTLTVGLAWAEGPDEDGQLQGVGPSAVTGAVIPIQGRLTDSSGNPINGTRNMTFRIYESSSGGTALCSDTDPVSIANGLFTAQMDFCTPSDIDGRQLYLGIQVGGDPEMTPRQAIFAVPYAWSLRPGAVISGALARAGL